MSWIENFVEQGVQDGKFSYNEARKDLQIALLYAFACLNADEYICYYKAAEWMKDSEENATGCGVWYYRYSVALMYCGHLKEALEYAEKGTKEEPDYPWIWLQAAKLRSHFGKKEAALVAVEQGLKIEPRDFEFLTLKDEINQCMEIEQMEYHYIYPEADQMLQKGLDVNADDKRRSISCIRINEKGLEEFWSIFGPKPEQYEWATPYIHFPYKVSDNTIELVFRMNEAGASKLDAYWMKKLKARIQSGDWLEREYIDGRAAILDSIFVGLDYCVMLIYKVKEEDLYFDIFLNPDGSERSFLPGKPELYTEEEMSAVEEHIEKTFGAFESVFHELISPDIHLDICFIAPSEERNYYTLVTMGMGAHHMNVPEELANYKLERVELAIALPAYWKLDEESMKDEKWYWPVRLLKDLARLPIDNNTWLGYGHTIDNQSPYANDTRLCASMLIGLQGVEEDSEICILPNGDEVNFYQVIPLCRKELEYKLNHDADELLDKMYGVSFVINPDRDSYIR